MLSGQTLAILVRPILFFFFLEQLFVCPIFEPCSLLLTKIPSYHNDKI